MTGIFSKDAGILFLPKSGKEEYSVFDISKGTERDSSEVKYIYSTAKDWDEIEGKDAKDILSLATQEYWIAYSVSHLRLAVRGIEKPLENIVFEHLEELLGSRAPVNKVLDRLLVAPLADSFSPRKVAASALAEGFSVVASILDELEGLQPPLRRLTDLWLGIEDAEFSCFSESRGMIWVTVVETCEMSKLLQSNNARDFKKQWNFLIFSFKSPQSRNGIGSFGELLSSQLFPHYGKEIAPVVQLHDEYMPVRYEENDRAGGNYGAYQRAQKQISSIIEAVSGGRDKQAKRFLKELVRNQSFRVEDVSHAVKSLCNIAQRCADMFRTDFEALCLEKARELAPDDAWSLIQYGDHQKREGNYKVALQSFVQAKKLGDIDIAESAIADVFSQVGRYKRAIGIYQRIPCYQDKPEVLTAIADNYRRMGDVDRALCTYDELLENAAFELSCDREARILSGKAEIAKIQGNLPESEKLYREILKRADVSDRDRIFYRLGLCNILKLREKFSEAFSVVDEVVQEYPFAMRARCTRGSILALFGREKEGLIDLQNVTNSRPMREWRGYYYQGLLLLKLARYTSARRILVDQLYNAVASDEDKVMLRMGAALCFLEKHDIIQAREVLAEIPDLYDCHAQYLSLVLKLHLAAQEKDRELITSLRSKIANIHIIDKGLERAISAINDEDFPLALKFETDVLIKLAA